MIFTNESGSQEDQFDGKKEGKNLVVLPLSEPIKDLGL
jgi:hypothetical protein